MLERTKELQALSNLINAVSRINSLDDIIATALLHLTTSEVFNFHYAIFSEINYLDDLIQVKNSICNNDYIVDPIHWRSVKGAFPLKGSDVMAVAIREDRIIEAKGAEVDYEGSSLEMDVFNAFNHQNLIRLFVPVKSRRSHNNKDFADINMGLIEVGCHLETINNFEIDKKIKLSIYADNLGQSLRIIIEKEIQQKIIKIQKDSERFSSDDHLLYLRLLLQSAVECVQANQGCISLLSFNSSIFDENENKIFLDSMLTDECDPINFDKEIFEKVYLGEAVFINNHPNNCVSKHSKSIRSIMFCPIRHNEQTIGFAQIISWVDNFFNQDKIFILENLFSQAGEIFIAKKFHNLVAGLVYPTNVLSDSIENFMPLINLIKKYFLTESIGVGLRDFRSPKKKAEYLETISKSKGEKEFVFQEVSLSKNMAEYIPINADTVEPNSSNIAFWDFSKANGFKSFIFVPLKLDAQEYGFINIYSKRQLNGNLFNEDKQFLELISNKIAVSYVTSKMINKFSIISQSLISDELSNGLQPITDSAMELLNSDPVILFRYDSKSGDVIYDQTIFSGYIKEPQKIYQGRRVSFINHIIAEGKEVFYTSEEELPTSYRLVKETGDTNEDNFWNREGIKSLAVIPLKYKEELIGIMCFNYRQKQTFLPQTVELVKAFSSFATIAIVNTNNLTLIRKQTKALEERAENLKQKYEDINKKVLEMLPVANASSLAEIVRAVNHDIRNHLLKVNQNLFNIRTDSFNNIRSASDRNKLVANIAMIEADINNSTNLIDLFEPNSFKISVESLSKIVYEIKDLFVDQAKKEKQEVEINVNLISSDIPDIRCSKAEIAMIIYNLISNAKKAIVEKWNKNNRKSDLSGKILLECGYDYNEKQYIINVEDDGIGVDKSNIGKIYEVGFTTGKQGLGIGLFFVKETLINNYKGSISCKSYVNNGTRFELKFKQHIK